ncbi:hypothetical protein [Pseudobacteriovorax antillogorgiicola]|uniref:Uncharacterized protein n=1 Tax=Pseudobacteriovorax antillogorgiicola TaxID=1513793 RepID=A0A1Y6C5N9_9BACT|nr:hypothetical protein [Pseudobacteriovorax antillogorgiicola]TCS51135.1 hypothetical protein EDD56_11116 [Pseudobacteriovorax antillogorgiicola]SMF38419.1 hypothetical protein SAMN06296036_111161 [Pseudobacteriovorax antillogorgiicola]
MFTNVVAIYIFFLHLVLAGSFSSLKAAELVLIEKTIADQEFFSSAVVDNGEIITTSHSLDNCPDHCRNFSIYQFDSINNRLNPIEYHLTSSFRKVDGKDLTKASITVVGLSEMPPPIEPVCQAFTVIPENTSLRLRQNINRLIKKMPAWVKPNRYLDGLLSKFTKEVLPAGLIHWKEVDDFKETRQVYTPISNKDNIFLVQSFLPKAFSPEYTRIGGMKVPCAGWRGSSGGAYFDESKLKGLITGATTPLTSALRKHSDFGYLNLESINFKEPI